MIHQTARDTAVPRLGREVWQALAASPVRSDPHLVGIEHCYDTATFRIHRTSRDG